jgi:uncharacterized membrane protein YgcG
MQTTPLALAFVLFAALRPPAVEITWQPSLDAAFERAKAEKKVLFVAVNMDGEGANDRTAKFVYKDKDVVALAASTVNVVASLARHADAGKPCGRFAGIECAVHQACDGPVRQKVLKPDPTGNVVAPEHVFLDSEGKPLLSVPYEVTASELEWCFVTAMQRADPSSKIAMPGSAHMPRRIVLGAVYDPTNGVGGAIQPLTKSDLAELIKSVKKGMEPEARQVAFWRILHSDSPDAIAFIQAELRSGGGGVDKPGSDPSGGGGGGSAGGGGGGNAAGDGGGAKHGGILHAMGAVSPSVYWELAVDFLDNADVLLRQEAAAALEQMAAPQALKAIEKALAKEKKPEVEKDFVRAWAACGAADPKVRAALVKRVRAEKDELVRTSLIVALGLVDPDPEVHTCIQEQLASKDDNRRAAGALAAALTRDETWIPVLEPLATASSAAVADAVGRALESLRGGSLLRLQMPVWSICKDQVTRERTFGKSPS